MCIRSSSIESREEPQICSWVIDILFNWKDANFGIGVQPLLSFITIVGPLPKIVLDRLSRLQNHCTQTGSQFTSSLYNAPFDPILKSLFTDRDLGKMLSHLISRHALIVDSSTDISIIRASGTQRRSDSAYWLQQGIIFLCYFFHREHDVL